MKKTRNTFALFIIGTFLFVSPSIHAATITDGGLIVTDSMYLEATSEAASEITYQDPSTYIISEDSLDPTLSSSEFKDGERYFQLVISEEYVMIKDFIKVYAA